MKTYKGHRTAHGAFVYVVDEKDHKRALPLRLDLMNHSPTGFEWGYNGSGPAQLALAILADALDDDKEALALYQLFKDTVIAPIRSAAWTMAEDLVAVQCDTLRRMLDSSDDPLSAGICPGCRTALVRVTGGQQMCTGCGLTF